MNSVCSHGHGLDALANSDPTRTTTLRRRYAQRLRGAFADINTKIREGVRDRDVFRLSSEALADDIPPIQFETDDRKVDAFMHWLRQQQESDILTVIEQDQNTFVRSAYGRGLQHAQTELRKEGVEIPVEELQDVFNLPVHQETLQILYTRNYEALQGITNEVAKQIADELTTGFSQGWNPRKMAREITDRVDSIGKTRATTLARTEIINAHSEATLNRYEQLGVDGVTIKAELTTAGDRRVCPLCKAREGKTVTIEEARSETFRYEADDDEPPSLSGTYRIRPPIHPSCRCSWLPVVQ